MMTDPIADMLTRIRNAVRTRAERVDIPASRIKLDMARILKEEGFIRAYKIVKDKKQGVLRLNLRYHEGEPLIMELKRASKPGRRVYVGATDVPKVMGGTGIAIISTSRGVMTDATCRRENVGGELLCYVW